MFPGKTLRFHALIALTLVLSACSSGSSSSVNTIATAVQDLTVDPNGLTTVITFTSTGGLSGATPANFQADGGQIAQTVAVNGDEVTVTWNSRVTPNHEVRAITLSGVSGLFHTVTTSDPTAPTFTITGATQNPNLGGDTIEITFTGPRVVETLAEDITKWTLVTGGQARPLTGSTFVLDVPSQTIDVVLGVDANLHATFTLAASGVTSVADVAVAAAPVGGNATGDTTAPTLVSANQNLTEDEYGRVVDFTFSEAMDPLTSLGLSHFSVTLPDVATTVEQPTEDVLRVTFNAPMVPGVNTVTLQTLVDLHGNSFPNTVQAISQPSPVANTFVGDVLAVTVANAGGDYVEAVTTQAFDPDSALNPNNWTLTVAGNPVNLNLQTLSYDFLGKTLQIDLSFDLQNGDSFTLTGTTVLDVDGQATGLVQTRTVAGDAVAPTVVFARQNRNVDPTGATVDVQFSEDVEQTIAETTGSWGSSGTQNVLSATLQPGLDLVRIVFDDLMVPGDVTLTAQNVQDLAGNTMVTIAGVGMTSTDTTPPAVTTFSATIHEGSLNDVVELIFDDDLIPAEITDPTKWTLESPPGTPLSTAAATVDFNVPVRRARLKLVNNVNMHRDEDFTVVLTGVRDLGGNAVPTTPMFGVTISETNLPYVHTVWLPTANLDQMEVRFSEACDLLTDLWHPLNNTDGTRYVLKDWLGFQVGTATSATSLDFGLGVRVSFGIVVDPSDTIDVIGPTDLAGNPLFPALNLTTVAEDTNPPALDPGQSDFVAVSGEDNDYVRVVFDRPISPWGATDHINYEPTGPTEVDKRTLEVTFDGVDTVTIPTRSNSNDYDLITGTGYDLEVTGLYSAQGVPITVPTVETGILVTGDVAVPTIQPDKVRIDPNTVNALLVEFREATAPPSMTDEANYVYTPGALVPLVAQILGPRTVRLTFGFQPVAGSTLTVTIDDRAGNGNAIARTIGVADAGGPLVSDVVGVLTPGWGGDEVSVSFDEPITGTSALNPANFSIQSGGVARSLTGASLSYSSTASTVTIRLAGGQDLQAGGALTVGVTGIQDFSGNPIASGLQIGGPTSGDLASPSMISAFVNRRFDPTGETVEVLFDEDVDMTLVSDPQNWTATGGPSVIDVEVRELNHVRVILSGAMPPAGTLQTNGFKDVAGNTAGADQIDPID